MFEVQDTDLPNLIELKNISQSYDGGKNFIIKDLNLLIKYKPAQVHGDTFGNVRMWQVNPA